jgi:CSLREA domain-containing protein
MRAGLVALVLLASLASVAPAGAVVYHVNSNADTTSPCTGSGTCTLRGAVDAANSSSSDDEIVLRAEHYGLSSSLTITGTGPDKLTITGVSARSTIIDGKDMARVFNINGPAELRLLTVTGGNGNAASGGGLNVTNGATLTDVAVTGNEATDNGGGIRVTGSVRLVDSLVSGNNATANGGGIAAESSGAIFLTNSTVSGNTAGGTGGVVSAVGETTSIVSSTISGNTGGGGSNADGVHASSSAPPVTVTNSIIAGNGSRDCAATAAGAFSSQGGNFAGPTCIGAGSAPIGSTANPLLGPLANNGGETDTRDLLTGSPAIDAATASGCPATDQRGLPRPIGKACDSGAFEVQAPPIVINPAVNAAPVISALSLSHKVFAVNARGQAAAKRKRTVPRGTTFRFSLSEAAKVTFTIERRSKGRKVGKRCRKPTRGNRKRKRCTRYVKMRSFSRAGKAGKNRVAFSGRVKKGRRVRKLARGRYRASLRATDSGGGKSKLRRVSFRIVRG